MRLFPAPLVLLAACDYSPPEDTAATVLNVIQGDVTIASPTDNPGNTFVLAFAADNPGPPAGTGSPVTFTSLPAQAYSSPEQGMQTAPYTMTALADGDYILNGLVDMDGDFHPLYDALAGATCGDMVGAHLTDLISQEFAPVHVEGGEAVDEITVVIGQTMTTERPAFVVDGFPDKSVSLAGATADALSQIITLTSTGVHSDMPLELADPGEACGVDFPLYGVDELNNTTGEAGADGQIDPHPNPAYAANGLGNVWPRLYLQYLGTPNGDGTFTNDLEEGESWATEAVPNPSYAIFGTVHAGEVTFVTDIDFLFLPGALHFLPDGSSEVVQATDQDGDGVSETPPAGVPTGAWSLTIISYTGQTWNTPNELPAFGSTADSFDPAQQGGYMNVTE